MWQAWEEDHRAAAVGMGLSQENPPLYPFAEILASRPDSLTPDDRPWQAAARLVHRALERADPGACREIARLYRDGGDLTPADPTAAAAWEQRATELEQSPRTPPPRWSQPEPIPVGAYWIPRSSRPLEARQPPGA
jgi:TPR repeat protein